MTSNGRVARLTALALATGTIVAANATGAAAATADTYTAGNAAGNGIIHLELNLPIAVPGIGQKLVQDIVVTNSAVRTGATPDAVASAVLGQNGNLPLVSSLLAGKSQATLAQPNGETRSGLPIVGNTLGIAGLLNLSSQVRNPNVDGVVSHSTSSVANLQIDGAGVLDAVLKPVLDQLNAVLGNLKLAPASSSTSGGTTVVVNTVTDAVNTLVSTLDAATNNQSAPVTQTVKDAVSQITTLLQGLLNNLQLNVSSISSDSSLLKVGLIQSEQTVTRAAGTVTSNVTNELVGVKVLGGLIGVDGLKSSATAALDKNGNPVATPTATGTLVEANLADILTAKVTDQIQAILGGTVGSALPADVLTQVNALLAQITGLVKNVLGVSFQAPAASTRVAQHDKASQEVAPATLVVNPLHAATPLMKIEFVPAAAQVLRAEGVTPPTVVTPPTQVKSLPRTGADLPLTGAIATGLVGLALVARRRRLAHLAD
ncbi:MAG: hypothetical protein ACXVFV_01115 [Mycobacteriales bacterium]